MIGQLAADMLAGAGVVVGVSLLILGLLAVLAAVTGAGGDDR